MAIQGPRQAGKSFLTRELLAKQLAALAYRTFDRLADREFATTNPETFLAQFPEARPLVLDEAQKVPRIFDAIKFEVDRERRPGRFLLLGSTEFSRLTLVRESLTGRISRVRLFPMNLAETLELPPRERGIPDAGLPRATRRDLLQFLERGGMPGIFAVRSGEERLGLVQDWFDLTTSRDLLQFPKIRLDPDLAMRILELVATLEEPEAGEIARTLKRDLRRIRTHLTALEQLFVLHRLDPHPLGTGKPIHFLCDVGFAHHLKADFERKLHTWLLHEELSQRMYRGDRESRLHYYRTPKGRRIHLIVTDAKRRLTAVQVFPDERLLSRDLELLRAFAKKAGSHEVRRLGLGAAPLEDRPSKIRVLSWESVA